MYQHIDIQQFIKISEEQRKELWKLSSFIHAHPEVGNQEHLASEKISEFLCDIGYTVFCPAFGVETAVHALFEQHATAETPCPCVIAEYDALEGLGHACGHNLIAAAALSAAWTAKTFAERHGLPVRLCLMGTPAEEQFCGKQILIDRGAFKDIDMAIMAHGCGRTATDEGALGAAKCRVSFHGKASHAAQAPQLGINALDAMVLFYNDLLQWKRNIAPDERVHGIITNGGDAPNIIPAFTQGSFYVRSPRIDGLEALKGRLEASARLGAKKTGARCEVEWFSVDLPVRVNAPLNERYASYWKEAGKDILINRGDEGRASTDMGNVTQILPGAQFRFSVNHEQPCALHTAAFRDAAATAWAFESALHAGAVMAHILLDYATDEAFRQDVSQSFSLCR